LPYQYYHSEMISIIICSVNSFALKAVTLNIEQTIGVPFEIIAMDNSALNEGICKVYNEAAKIANFDLLVFVHEDVKFETMEWGKIIADHLAEPSTGLLGIAGGDAKSLVPSSWSIPVYSNEINVYQHYKSVTKPAEHLVVSRHHKLARKSQAVAVDGVFLCTKKTIFNQFRFDEEMLDGFHGYDIDFSLQVNTGYKVFVIFDVLLHHFSAGTPNRKWIETARLISNKWRHKLPVTVDAITEVQLRQHHWESMQVYLQKLIQLNYSIGAVLINLLVYSCNRFFRIRRVLSMGKFIGLEYLQRKKRY
jgi:Glycosyltransferase like family